MVMGDLVREVDVAVVGGGPGGYTAAFRCAELGLETVVADAGPVRGVGDEQQVVEVDDALVATRPAPRPGRGLELAGDRIQGSPAALAVAAIPDRLVVVGGGYGGLEVGRLYAALRSKGTL